MSLCRKAVARSLPFLKLAKVARVVKIRITRQWTRCAFFGAPVEVKHQKSAAVSPGALDAADD